jgi:hypothetical protein
MDANLRHYSIAEIAEMTGFSERSIGDDLRSGRYKHVKHGGKRWMTKSQIEAWLRAKSVEPRAKSRTELSDDDLDAVRASRRAAGPVRRTRRAAA